MNTPAASSAAVRHDTATTASSATVEGEPNGAFELLFGEGFALPFISAPRSQVPPADSEATTPELALADLSGWMQQLPLSPLPNNPDTLAPAPTPSPLALLQGEMPVAADSETGAALDLTLQTFESAGTSTRSEALAGPFLAAPAVALAVQPRATVLAEVMTRALLQRTEFTPPTPAALNAPTAPMPQAPLEVALPPGSAPKIEQAFVEGMAVRLNWMAQQQAGRAEIQLHPAELGSIDVQIEFEGKSVKADFQSPVAEVRQLLESTLPRLRELLEAQGLQLRHADVGTGEGQARGGHDRAPGSPGSPAGSGTTQSPATSEPDMLRTTRPPGHEGVLSEYA